MADNSDDMKHLFLIPLVAAFFLQPVFLQAEILKNPAAQELITSASAKVKEGLWDDAEKLYLKAAESPEVGDRIEAYASLAALYKKVKLPKKAEKAERNLRGEKELQKRLLPEDNRYYTTYKIRKGDTYGKIAGRLLISQKWLLLANNKEKLIEGRTIKVPRFRYEIEVDKRTKKLYWKRKGEVIKVYSVSVGHADTQTPQGKFRIVNKITDPVWYHKREVIPPGSPKNLLGPRWLGLSHKGYGIHGTKDPDGIGSAVSHGCVRMFNHDVEELFAWIPVGTKVTIHENMAASVKPKV